MEFSIIVDEAVTGIFDLNFQIAFPFVSLFSTENCETSTGDKNLFLNELLVHNTQQPTLFLTLDTTDDPEEPHKKSDVKSAAPLKCWNKGVALVVILYFVIVI